MAAERVRERRARQDGRARRRRRGARSLGRRSLGHLDVARVRAARVPRAGSRPRLFARRAPRTRVGARYDGGARTVDIHVRRLRAKLGDALPLETVRGSGYKLRTPAEGRRQSPRLTRRSRAPRRSSRAPVRS
ncbi:MAG: winged helix-turn-helix domain-containing protein [Polyangiaceae bacterium]